MQHNYKDKNSFGISKEPQINNKPREAVPFPVKDAYSTEQSTQNVPIQRATQKQIHPSRKATHGFDNVEPYTQPIPKIKGQEGIYDDFGRVKKTKVKTKVTKESKSKAIISWVLSIALAVGIAFTVRIFLFEIILVDGESMFPTLSTDQRVAVEKVSRYFSLPKRGDVIIVLYPNSVGTYVKRVIGRPGETIEVKDSTVYIDGVALKEDYINKEPYADMAPVVVPEDSVFVMGDNRAHSLDSRTEYIGAIPQNSIVGHGTTVIWPLNQIHNIA